MKSQIPQISISLAPPVEILEEPYSPFSPGFFVMREDDDAFRLRHLTPPASHVTSPRFPKHLSLSPLRPPESPVAGTGLERERFEAMLQASRERSAAAGAKKAADLRKEIALKAHKSKQVERRALFLSKLQAPPSPSAVSLPKTPPESPAIFHYTLPSPGLNSPLALFDALTDDNLADIGLSSVEPWVEQVDFRLPKDMQSKSLSKSAVHALRAKLSKPSKPIPSLDQISARLSSQGHVSPPPRPERASIRLPAFLLSHSGAPPRAPIPTDVDIDSPVKPSFPIGTSRLQMPIRPRPISPPKISTPTSASGCAVVPASLDSTVGPKLQITTTIVPRSATLSSGTELSERNVSVLVSRARTARDMLSTLKRRMHPSEEGLTGYDLEGEERKERRRSAPAEMEPRGRSGFMHPVFDMPGGF